MTEIQEAVLSFMQDYQQREGIPPSTREIARHFGFQSQNSAVKHLRSLAKKELIEQLSDRSWGVKAREIQGHFLDLPVYGTIPAGLPAFNDQAPVETIAVEIAAHRLQPRKKYWALVVQGDSMIDAHIVSGDIAILERREPQPGEIIAALVDDTTTTLKRFLRERGRAILRAANPRYPDLRPDRLECQGVLVSLIGRGAR